jgi:hypothetical protein
VERIQIARGNGYERVMRLAMAVEGATRPGDRARDGLAQPGDPDAGAKADAAVKMYGGGHLADKPGARRLRLLATTIKAMEEREAQAESAANGPALGA